MNFETILYEAGDGIAYITLNRPKKLNAMNAQCIAEMRAALAEIRADDDVRVVVLRGAGERAFTAGADISELADKTPGEMEGYNREWLALFDDIEGLAKPVIACLGLTYKADVDDLRESPAVDVVLELADMAVGELLVVDPLVQQLPQSLAELGLSLTDFDVAVDRANVILLLVDHGAFKSIDRELIKDKIVVDTRGIW